MRIFVPMAIKTRPPANSARDLNRVPKKQPTWTPIADKKKVVAAMIEAASIMLTFRKANETPTASASILVATARGSMAMGLKEGLGQESGSRDSLIILPPMRSKRKKTIQWSNPLTSVLNLAPTKYPISGIPP